MEMMKMGNITPGMRIEPTSLAYRATGLTIKSPKPLDITILHCRLPVDAAPCLEHYCGLLTTWACIWHIVIYSLLASRLAHSKCLHHCQTPANVWWSWFRPQWRHPPEGPVHYTATVSCPFRLLREETVWVELYRKRKIMRKETLS